MQIKSIDSENSRLSARQQIAKSLRPWRLRVYAANIAALTLGLLAATLGVLIGPALKLLLSPELQYLTWSDLFGPAWGSSITAYSASPGVSASSVYFWLPFALLTIATVKSFLTFWQWYTWEKLGELLAYGWRQNLVESFVNVSSGQRDDGHIKNCEMQLGGLMSQDIRTCRDYVVHFFGGLPREGFQVVFLATSLCVLSPKLFFIFFFCLAPVVILLSRLGKKLRKRASAALADNSLLGEWIQQRLLGIETIKQFQTEKSEVSAMRLLSQDLFERFLRAARLKARTSPLIEFLGVAGMAVVLAIAFSDIANNQLSGSVAMSFFSSLALLGQSAAKMGRYFNSNREGMAAAERIFTAEHAFRVAGQTNSSHIVFKETSDKSFLKLKNVSLTYGKTTALHQFSYKFESGRVYCLVGRSGAGKSSVFNAILGLRPPVEGAIEGAISAHFKDRTLDVAYLPQALPVISATLGEIVSYPLLTHDVKRAQRALDVAHFTLDQDRISQGLQTVVGPGGVQLSGGQLQRLQLSRLVYHHAPFVLVDEGTSALDPELESVVLDFVRDLAKNGAVVLMIAHRQSAVDACDELLLLEDGRLVAAGDRAEVSKSQSFKDVFR